MVAKKLTVEFISQKILQQTQNAFICSAIASDWALDLLRRNLSPLSQVNLIIGLGMPSPLKTIETLSNGIPNWTTSIFTKRFFHPKFYLFHLTDDSWLAFVGSGNFTKGGFVDNEELFLKIKDQDICAELKLWFNDINSRAKPLTKEIFNDYSTIFPLIAESESRTKAELSKFIDRINSNFNIDNVDFTDQFFSKNHHLTFLPAKRPLDTPDVVTEREEVRRQLYYLNDLLVPAFPRQWDIHEHYDSNHIVSSIDLNLHHGHEIGGLWVAYGRSQSELKKYSRDATPLYFMRMQVLIRYDDVGIWLMPGKSNGGGEDREYFKKKMREDSSFRKNFFELLTGLGNDYWIQITEEQKSVVSFTNPDELQSFSSTDDWRNYYFILGRNYVLGSMVYSSTINIRNGVYKNEINIEHLASGMYFITVRADKNLHSRFIINH